MFIAMDYIVGEWKGVCWATLEWWGSSKEHVDILRSEGGGELTSVVGA